MINDDSAEQQTKETNSAPKQKSIFHPITSRLPSKRQFKYASTVFSGKEKNILKILVALIVATLFWVLGSYYFSNYSPIPTVGGDYTEGIVGAPLYINPILSQTNDVDLDISNLIFSSLLKYDKNQALVPDLATEYSVNDEGTLYTVKLREDAYWQGKSDEKITADDVIFTLIKIQSPEINSPLYASFLGVSFEKIDDFTVRFSLKKPFAPFPSLLTFGILPEHLWTNIPDQNFRLAELNLKPIGSGPWQVISLNKDKVGNIKSISLLRNTRHYGSLPFLTKITFKFYGSIQEASVGLERKEIDGLSFVPSKQIPELTKKNKKLNSYSLQIPQYTALFFNFKQNPALKEKNVRRALAHSINKAQISQEALGAEGQIIHSPILPGMLGYNDEIKDQEFNITKANDLLTEAKWKKISIEEYIDILKKEHEEKFKEEQAEKEENKDESSDATEDKSEEEEPLMPEFVVAEEIHTYPFFRTKGDNLLSIKITTVNLPENIRTANIIENAWKQLGILTEIEAVDSNAIKNTVIRERSYQTLLFGHIIGSDPDPYPFWHSSQIQDPGLNLASFSDKKADKLLLEARETKDLEKRETLYKEFQEILHEELPAIFLYNPTYNYLVHKKIMGMNPLINIIIPADRFNDLSNWYIKTKRQRK